ncbi:Zinc finger MYM-type protein 1 [Holothuria leucospilota]|uniref:Zinc finger MYM-type protein 1 n=1 Tax=Holothuria leucospilota TaxID=206669 RepID=A0A9Q1HHB5_HOLLE|nr:Zinc finger MYM-type protein 1 [Holothuria leucospilota]
MEKQKSSVLKKLQATHAEEVQVNRNYLKAIIETLVFCAQQNIPLRGNNEKQDLLCERSDVNRGNFLELLSLRCRDIPWLKSRFEKQSDIHRSWISPAIQNELLQIHLELLRKLQAVDFRDAVDLGLILDETSDLSRDEQVSVCIRWVHEGSGETSETFLGFFKTAATDGKTLLNLTKDALLTVGVPLSNIIGQCMDGASNMSGKERGLSTRIKEVAPKAIYVHCYGHVLNLALQDTISTLEPLRNALGVFQSLYNLLEASSKRHAFFEKVEAQEEDEHAQKLTLKSLSVTRWSCRYDAEKAVINQLSSIMKALVTLSEERDVKTHSDSISLIHAMANFEFIFGLVLLRVILSNTHGLSQYLQSAKMDVAKASKSAEAVIKTLRKCRSDEAFDSLWSTSEIYSDQVRSALSETDYEFRDPRVPHQRRPSKRVQALLGQESDDNSSSVVTTAKDHYRRSCYFVCVDKVVAELEDRFQGNDHDVLYALGDLIYKKEPAATSFQKVS